MKLYVSDLDGTLLNSNKELSDFTKKTINQMIAEGIHFTIATARSYSSAKSLIEPLDLKLPIILNNGGFVYDPVKEEFILENYLAQDMTQAIVDILLDNAINPIIHLKNQGKNQMFYRGLFNYGEKHYYEDRRQAGDDRFTLVENYHLDNKEIITIFAIDEYEKLKTVEEQLQKKFNVQIHLFKDVYSNFYWLEMNHPKANKKSGINFLKNKFNFEKIIGFGDNLNDLSMFEVCDEKYAVENAHEELKVNVNGVLKSNDHDGVAQFLAKDVNFSV
jgi:Cof subfamily protein (haloacid dehalogenase superfamily)